MWPALLTKLAGLATGINIGQVLPVMSGFLMSAGKNIKTYWRFYLPVLLVILQAGTLYEWSQTRDKLTQEKVSHAQDVANFKKVQAEADAKAQAARDILKKEAKANADEADASYATLLSKYRANLLRYKASQSYSIKPHNYKLPATEGGNGQSTSPELSSGDGSIVISLDDAQICAVNTARLEAVHDWAVSLPKEINK